VFNGGLIGRITTDGTITEYPIPTAHSHPSGIAPGPDGAVWFAEAIGNIGRVGDAPDPKLRLSTTSGPPGTDVVVSISNYGSFERIRIVFVDSVNGESVLLIKRTNLHGGFKVQVQIPPNATIGQQLLTVRGVTSHLRTQAGFTVT
jgi:hypothetical protein